MIALWCTLWAVRASAQEPPVPPPAPPAGATTAPGAPLPGPPPESLPPPAPETVPGTPPATTPGTPTGATPATADPPEAPSGPPADAGATATGTTDAGAPPTTATTPGDPAADGVAATEPPVVPSSPVIDRIAAVVNDEVITLSEVYELGREFVAQRCPNAEDPCVGGAELEVLDALIRRSLIHQELARLQLDVSASDVDQAIDRTVRQYQLADRQALRTEVEASGKRWDQYREELFEFLRNQAFQARVLAPRVSVSDDELRDMYQRTARKVTKPVVKVSGLGIAIPADATPEKQAEILTQANQLVEALNKSEIQWDQAVSLYDAGARGMFDGQEFSPGSVVEPLAGVMFAAPIGVVQPPVRMASPSGIDVLFVLRVDAREEKSEVAPFEDVKSQLQDQVFQQKLQDAEEEWYQRARREAAVDVKLKAG